MYGLRRIGCHFAGVGRVRFADRALEQRLVVQTRVALEPLRQRQIEPESAAYTFSRPGMSHCSSMLSSGTWARKKSVTTPSRSAAIWSETSCDSRMEFLN